MYVFATAKLTFARSPCHVSYRPCDTCNKSHSRVRVRVPLGAAELPERPLKAYMVTRHSFNKLTTGAAPQAAALVDLLTATC